MRYFIAACSLLVLLAACSENKEPSGVIGRDKMTTILWDMIQADRFSAQYLLKDSAHKNVKLETLKLYEQVFQLHNISKEEFIKSYRFYLSRPDITKVMLDSLAVYANKTRENLMKETLRKDSLRMAKDNLKRPADSVLKPARTDTFLKPDTHFIREHSRVLRQRLRRPVRPQ